jgi:zinc D-Ala-D-Ala carboxypeptidase
MNAILALVCAALLCSSCAPSERALGREVKPPDPRHTALEASLSLLPEDAQAGFRLAYEPDKERFFALLEDAEAESRAAGDFLMLVDKATSLPEDYEPADLVSLNDYPLARNRADLRLRKAIMPALLEMDAAAQSLGLRLVYSSAYRSYAYQREVYDRWVRQLGQAEADRVSARPGHSQHQLGTAIDFGSIDNSFADTAAGRWLFENAWRYGFSLSYPRGYEALSGYDWESWHYRYLGKAGTLLERDYFGGLQQYFLLVLHAYRGRMAAPSP